MARDRLAGAVARRIGAVDGGGAVDVVALEVLRAVEGSAAHQGGERHHGSAVAAHVETVDVFRLHALGSLRLGLDPVGASEQVEVVDVITAEESLQHEEHFAQRNAQRFDLVAVDFELDLGNAGIEAAVDEPDLGTLAGFAQEVLQDLTTIGPCPRRRGSAART